MNEARIFLFVLVCLAFFSALGRCTTPVSQLEADIAPPNVETNHGFN